MYGDHTTGLNYADATAAGTTPGGYWHVEGSNEASQGQCVCSLFSEEGVVACGCCVFHVVTE